MNYNGRECNALVYHGNYCYLPLVRLFIIISKGTTYVRVFYAGMIHVSE